MNGNECKTAKSVFKTPKGEDIVIDQWLCSGKEAQKRLEQSNSIPGSNQVCNKPEQSTFSQVQLYSMIGTDHRALYCATGHNASEQYTTEFGGVLIQWYITDGYGDLYLYEQRNWCNYDFCVGGSQTNIPQTNEVEAVDLAADSIYGNRPRFQDARCL